MRRGCERSRVGAGSAGAVIASRLTETRAHEVVIVEGESDYPIKML